MKKLLLLMIYIPTLALLGAPSTCETSGGAWEHYWGCCKDETGGGQLKECHQSPSGSDGATCTWQCTGVPAK